MKAITLHQPWATLIALNVKRIETRSWRAPASLIGQRIAIHAGATRGVVFNVLKAAARDLDSDAIALCNALYALDIEPIDLPLGAIVATATLADCVRMVSWTSLDGPATWAAHMIPEEGSGVERLLLLRDAMMGGEALRTDGPLPADIDISDQLPYGNFQPGRWAWMLTDITPCGPVPAKGKQGLWNWEPQCFYSLGHRNRHQCDCVCVRPLGHDGHHRCIGATW